MKAKTIKATLRKKVDAWIASIDDFALREDVRRDTIVTGGCIASMLLREKVNDYDVYFKTRETALRVASYYIGKFKPKAHRGIPVTIYIDDRATDRVKIVVKSAGIASEDGTDTPYDYFEGRPAAEAGEYVSQIMNDPGDTETLGDIEDLNEETDKAVQEFDAGLPNYRPVFLSTNAITLSNQVQIILRFYGKPDEIHENYDFAHCTCYWESNDGHLELRHAALEALLTRELRYVGSKYPVCSLIRLRKFIARGWTINAGQILKMVMQCQSLDLSNVQVLQDQLTGVDVAYFCELISKLKDKDPEKVNSAYLLEIIDRMF